MSHRSTRRPVLGSLADKQIDAQTNAVSPGHGLSRRSLLQALALGGAAAGVPLARAQAPAVQPPAPSPMAGDWLIEAGWVLAEVEGTLKLQRNALVLVRNGLIEAVRAEGEAPLRAPAKRLSLPGDILLPGFISGHTHCCSATPTRGIIENPRSYRRPLELVERLADDELDALTALNLAELLRSGCTTQVEMSLSLRQAEAYVRQAVHLGARGYPGAMIPGIERLFDIWFRSEDQVLHHSEPDTLAEIARNLGFCKAHMGKGEGRIQPMLSPHACDTHTPATLRALADGARELGTGLHIHLSQGKAETETVRRLWGKTPTQ
ncbi:MAG: amidohydrolase family protein, partial [Lamprobacter sp.]|uniref:amidohydrolase family protein n=1 Tax=Lamprobacter sp. TaxID=3100796 RepID=UPI002B2593B2